MANELLIKSLLVYVHPSEEVTTKCLSPGHSNLIIVRFERTIIFVLKRRYISLDCAVASRRKQNDDVNKTSNFSSVLLNILVNVAKLHMKKIVKNQTRATRNRLSHQLIHHLPTILIYLKAKIVFL